MSRRSGNPLKKSSERIGEALHVTLEPGQDVLRPAELHFPAIASGSGGRSGRPLSDRVFPLEHIAPEEEVMSGEFSSGPLRGNTRPRLWIGARASC
jgi:hypothetical protein